MKTTKITIRNLFGISEQELSGKSAELTGANGTGKTSVIDAIRYALTNRSERDFIVKNGETEGEIIIETDSGLHIDRRKRVNQADYKSVKENGREVASPESFLRELFTPLQINPVEFIGLPKNEQNRIILDLIDFPWDLNLIREWFGEIPSGVDYEQNILQVLDDIQSENGDYFRRRQDINRDIRNKKAFVADIAKDIPAQFQAEKWENYNLGEVYMKITEAQKSNNLIDRAQAFRDSYENKIRGYEAEKEIELSGERKKIQSEKETLIAEIERLKADIRAKSDRLGALDEVFAGKAELAESHYREKLAKLDGDMKKAAECLETERIDTAEWEAEARTAEEMKKHLNEYRRMKTMQEEIEELSEQSSELTRKIELARALPGTILQTAAIPIEGFSVENGIPLIHGLPVSNLSEGEKLSLCIDVALSKPNGLRIILIDGAEKLSDENRMKLYDKCREKGLQFIATRTTNDSTMAVNYL
jgi:exonuclease SbcC